MMLHPLDKNLIMKNTTQFILTLVFIFSISNANAKVWTVDNTPGAGADTNSLPGMIFKASAGDTIIVMPSLTLYSGFTLSKKMHIYTRGFTSNSIDKDKSVEIGGVSINYNVSGCVLRGLKFSGITIYGDNNLVENCYVPSLYCAGSNNLIIGCVFENTTNTITIPAGSYNNIVSNCFFTKRITNGSYSGTSYTFIEGGNSTNLIKNCNFFEIISGGNVSNGGFLFFRNSYAKIYNNILWSNHPSRTNFDTLNLGSVFKNNLTYSVNTQPRNLKGSNNLNDTFPEFVGEYNATNLPIFRASNNMRLKNNTVGKFAGTDSTEIGLYGGNYNFSFEGNVPGVAIFDDFEVLNPVVKKGGVLKVKATARKPE